MSEDKKVSVSEFKNWLDGVLDFQPEDWVPDRGQWEKILNKIKQLDENTSQPARAAPVPAAPKGPRNPRPVPPLNVGKAEMDATVELPDIVPERQNRQVVTVQQNGPPKIVDAGDGGAKIIDTGQIHKTGNINTRDGNYTSDWA
jgi:hypothetical protein